ncbi:hypothetical protein JW905_10260 [bacterium]|nr:hypothetical protein [candidate division CSSED10-310 bacterium]
MTDRMAMLFKVDRLRIRDERERTELLLATLDEAAAAGGLSREGDGKTGGSTDCRLILPGEYAADGIKVPGNFPQPVLVMGRLAPCRGRCAVINSRRPLAVNAGDQWVRCTVREVRAILRAGSQVVTSVGTRAYDLVTRICARESAAMIMVAADGAPLYDGLPAGFLRVRGDRGPPPGRWLIIGLRLWRRYAPPRAVHWQRRDRLVVELAQHISAVGVRTGGIMQGLIEEQKAAGKAVSVIELDTEPTELHHRQPADCAWASPLPGGGLYHYTRACHGPWPGESYTEFLDSLIDPLPGTRRDGFGTLVRILRERLLRASGALIKGGFPVVCFSAAPPSELLSAGWASHLVRWRFTPYGIGFTREYLAARGVDPVTYCSPEERDALEAGRRHLYQKHLPPTVDWTAEKEWRLAGDLDFSDCPDEAMVVFVATRAEADALSEICRCTVIPLCDGEDPAAF